MSAELRTTDGPDGQTPRPASVTDDGAAWRRLHSRMIWVDLVQSLVSLAPAVAVWAFDVAPEPGTLWPLFGVAAVGVAGAVSDAFRWVFTRYRVTDGYVERRSGVFVRSYRSVRRERIRTVDIEARLRHRLAGLRMVTIGAGQQTAAGESALVLDAVLRADAERLRRLLQRHDSQPHPVGDGDGAPTDDAAERTGDGSHWQRQVFARFRPHWVVYNLFTIWAYVMALGLLWGGYWLGDAFGLDLAALVGGLLDWQALGRGWTIVIGVVAVGVLGVVGLALNFFAEYWNFELARVPGEQGTLLRTRQGLFTTREINRDDRRIRGIQIAEPLLWRWMGVADTTVITTGLPLWSLSQPTAVLPRGPIGVARAVCAAVLDADPDPLEVPLRGHPRAGLRRRLWWAALTSAVVVGVLGWLDEAGVIPAGAVWAGVALWPFALGAAVVAYRALGHAIAGEYVVFRSGLVSRTTAALQRPAVSTIAIRQSPLQRRLGLATVSAMTAAGYGAYDAPDVSADEAVAFATEAAPGLLDPFVVAGGNEAVAGRRMRARATVQPGA